MVIEFTPVSRPDIPSELIEPLQLGPLVAQLNEAQVLLRGIANWCIGVAKPYGAPHMRTLSATVIDSRFDWERPHDDSGRLEPRFLWWAGPSEYRWHIQQGAAVAGQVYNSHGSMDPQEGDAPNTAICFDELAVRELSSEERGELRDYFNELRVPRGYKERQKEDFSDEFALGERALLMARPVEVVLPVERHFRGSSDYAYSGGVSIPPSALIQPLKHAEYALRDPEL